MNREERRKYNRQHHTNYSANDFTLAELYARLQSGNLEIKDLNDLKLNNDYIHIDNDNMAPDGMEVMLNYKHIKQRSNKLNPKFVQFIENNKDKVMHITREKAENGMVCMEEDPDHIWLFDIYADLLYKNENNEWVDLVQIELAKGDLEDNGTTNEG